MRNVVLAILVLGTSLTLVPAPAARADDADDLALVLERFDRVQESIRTLRAEFVETTTSPLLQEPVVSEGRFFLTKPDNIRWEYDTPEEMRFVIANDQYTGYFPVQRRAERRDVRRWREQLFRFFGVGQGSEELAKLYDLHLMGESDEVPGTYLLVLEPKKRRARKRVEDVRFWLDTTSLLPRRVAYSTTAGHSRVLEFTSVVLNPDLAAGLYEVDLPPDVVVSDGFSGLPNFSPDATR